jgi:hypothetical protein
VGGTDRSGGLRETLIRFEKDESRACPELAEGFLDFAGLLEKRGIPLRSE